MSGAFIAVKIDDSDFEKKLSALLKKVDDLSPVMKNIGIIMEESIRENFVEQGRPNPWKPLSEKTLLNEIGNSRGFKRNGDLRKRSIQALADKKILIDRGMNGGLMDSINSQPDSTSVLIGTDKKYGAIHQFGGMAGKNKKVSIPARPFIVMQDEDKAAINGLVCRYISPIS